MLRMGCGSSKVQRDNDPPNTGYDKPRTARHTATRPRSQRTGSQGNLATGTAAGNRVRPPPTHLRPHRSEKRVPHSRATRPKSQFQTESTAEQSRAGTSRRSPKARRKISSSQPSTDKEIRVAINSFKLFIDQHLISFYRTQFDDSGASIPKYITRTVISNIIEKRLDETSVARNLSNALEKYAENPADGTLINHLLVLCRMASEVRSMTDGHPESWVFNWGENADIVFPSVMRGKEEFMEADMGT
ncbi:hypothetical protein HCEG_02308 [Histoplasma capsulatum var. duboisii H88]|uniref:Uncharacterized protein n=1 Tax=Ajellomyces capsulatus (strain H88) TaxID=544711 RepID=F0UBN7_AJEC8|nr:hypothetical protein HCEG_02308 [Histoplasma capsulatum var. duboisii H88]QSS49277.1 hypothetical protein I7I53_09593 [Histoplasma capsulatum var. duboisii H88]